MKLKVCGMKYNAIEVAKVQPDYLGFIFYDKSPRNFEGEIPELPDSIKKVGVFVDEKLDVVLEKVIEYGLNAVQLHGNESPEYCKKLKRHYDKCQFERIREQNDEVISSNRLPRYALYDTLEIIKIFSIKEEFDFSVLKHYEEVCDYYLFDTKGKLPGGNGYTFNWNVLKEYPSTKPYFLSGGIGLDEIDTIKSFTETDSAKYCHAIDVNSRFEIEPGLKNIEKLKKFKEVISHFE